MNFEVSQVFLVRGNVLTYVTIGPGDQEADIATSRLLLNHGFEEQRQLHAESS
jgi:hypothetical protein